MSDRSDDTTYRYFVMHGRPLRVAYRLLEGRHLPFGVEVYDPASGAFSWGGSTISACLDDPASDEVTEPEFTALCSKLSAEAAVKS